MVARPSPLAFAVIAKSIPKSLFNAPVDVLEWRLWFWSFGHPLVYFWLVPAVTIWFLPKVLGTVGPLLLTLGPLGEFITTHWGLGWAQAIAASVYAAWLAALAMFYADTAKRVDL